MKKFVISLVFLSLCLKYGWSALHRDDKIEGWLNGKKLLEATDMTFIEAGGVGVWTKADAATSFDDLTVKSAHNRTTTVRSRDTE
ncbi:MAG: hypothetical protein IIB56_07250 [Planctomycetes bacterium]|nr:hypothetical protein [Planctomycetota bacterium]MCH8118269.1 hypothetical protein [Planctomycetota bacterium]